MQYNAILIDPPWSYERTHGQGIAEREYNVMTWDDLKALGPLLHAVAAPNCAIFMWMCAPLLFETVDMVRAWDLRYITKGFCWLKLYADGGVYVGLGSHTRGNTEDVWLLSNGTPKRKDNSVIQPIVSLDDALLSERMRHSRKPEEVHRRIERLVHGPYLEVFARRRRAGWTCIGNDVDGLDIRDSLARIAADAPLPVLRRDVEQHSLLEVA